MIATRKSLRVNTLCDNQMATSAKMNVFPLKIGAGGDGKAGGFKTEASLLCAGRFHDAKKTTGSIS
jgi:hypothetical protein